MGLKDWRSPVEDRLFKLFRQRCFDVFAISDYLTSWYTFKHMTVTLKEQL